MVRCDDNTFDYSGFIQAIRQKSQKSTATSSAFVLLEWCSVLIQTLRGTSQWQKYGTEIVLSAAEVLEKCLATSSKHSIIRTSLVVSRRAFRKLFADGDAKTVQDVVSTLTSKGQQPTRNNSIILGVIAGVCARIESVRGVLESLKPSFFEFYNREIVNSRTLVPHHIACGLNDFFTNFTSLQDFETQLLPAIEKGLLRSPEIVLDGVLKPLVTSLPTDVDLGALLQHKLLKPLLSAVKSSNPAIRTGAVAVFRAIASRSNDLVAMDKAADELSNPLKTGKLASPDHRVLYSEMIESLPLSNAGYQAAASALASSAIKEGNEAALIAEAAALTKVITIIMQNGEEVAQPVSDAFSKGMVDKKPPMRKVWLLNAGATLHALGERLTDGNCTQFTEAVIPQLVRTFTEVVANVPTAAQNGLIVGAYILTALFPNLERYCTSVTSTKLLSELSLMSKALNLAEKQPFLLSQRTYSKVLAEDELQWFSKALVEAARHVTLQSPDEVRLAWAEAVIYLVTATSVPPLVQRLMANQLSRLYAKNADVILDTIVSGLWHVMESGGGKDKDTMIGKSNLNKVIRALCLDQRELEALGGSIQQEQLQHQACALLVLSRPELIPKSSWIELCLTMGLDPGHLAQVQTNALLKEVGVRSAPGQPDVVKEAAFRSAADLAFVAPEVIFPKLNELVSRDLDATQLHSVGPVEAAIFKAPPDYCFIDVLGKKTQAALPNKHSTDFDFTSWEQNMLSEMAKRKSQHKKLTGEDATKFNAQLKKEADIRENLEDIRGHFLRGIGIIEALATGSPTESTLWLGLAVKLLLGIIDAGASLIIGNAAADAFLVCSEKVSPRLGAMRPFVGAATLRLRDVAVPENFTEEPLDELVTRALYRLRFAGEQRPFDVATLMYTLPLLVDILHKGGVGDDDDDRDAQLVLAIEILSFHTNVCEDESLPRGDLLSTLIETMQSYAQHYKLVKDCFTDMCRCIAPNISNREIAVLAKGTTVSQTSIRTTVLQAISSEVDMSELSYSNEIWLACHDDVEDNRELGTEIWEESGFTIDSDVPMKLVSYLTSKDAQLRRAASRGIADGANVHKEAIGNVVSYLRTTYLELAKPRLPQLDEYGIPKKMDLSDPWEARQGIATAFKELAPVMDSAQLDGLFEFWISAGPFADQNVAVRSEMIEAAIQGIDAHGKIMVEKLMAKFESTLEKGDKNSDASDRLNEAVIIIYGALARHLDAGDAKIPVVIERLLATLGTPSETVQYAISECLPPLIKACASEAPRYFESVVDELLNSKQYASQRGAAYGLAGLIQGRGISALREFRILSTLRSAMENKKEANQREAALIAFELLSTILGRLFEPYVIQIVPQLLSGFGDSNGDVRDACLAAAKACFGKLSSYGVKQIMPTLLDGLDDQQWRSKRGACDLLGAMAYLDPNQLATSLPDIIPPLTGVLNDSHKEVRAAANRSLKRFGEVITNPEIKSLVDILLKALSDPTKYTDEALDALIKVQFVHYLDAPSLALVTRILERGLGDRSNTKRKAAQVIGSLAHLTEKKDITVHLPILVAGLKVAAVDPVPTTRATASRALGSLVEKLGEDALPDLIPGLMQTLKSDTGAGDRLGSAQALSEVLAGLGTSRLEETLPTVLQNVDSAKPSVREGFMSLFIFLPVCFGNSFSNYLGRIVPPILAGLADDVEAIRDTALRAGRLLVKNFAVRAVDLLLPELERGLADDSYRIRLSSVELVGDLLFNLTGVKANADEIDEDDETVKEAGASLKEVLGEEKRNKILSALYVCRCDTAGSVRSAAISVWKVLVHSPRILKELVPTLTQLLIRRLGSSNMEHKVIASNALGELIRKAGDGVLATLLPTLEEGLQTSTNSDAKQGICLALRELISSAAPESLEDHETTLISVVRTALTDSDVEVREAAAEAFDSLQDIFGKRAVDQVLPYFLNMLRSDDEAQNALSALLTLLTETTRSNIILPTLIPTLTTPPISAFDAKALASLSRVAGAAMNRRLPSIINSLLDNEINCSEEELRTDLVKSFDTVIQSIDEYDGLSTVMSVLLGLVKHEDHHTRAATARHLATFFSSATVDYSRYNQDIIRTLLNAFDDSDADVVKAAWSALADFTKKLKKEEMETLVPSTRQTLQRVGVSGANLRGFELPKGINAVLPIFLQGLMNGTADQRVQAALGISDIVDRTSEASLKPFVTQITGPLIRVVSERSTEVKSAILFTLNNLLEKMPTALKPFLPQLQRTFAKSLADTTSEVLRTRAAKALGTLIKYTPRIDPLIAELVTGSKTTDAGVKTAMLKALYEVISRAGGNMGEAARNAVLSLIDTETDDRNEGMTVTNAKLLGSLIKNVPENAASSLLKNRVVTATFSPSSALALNAVLAESREALFKDPISEELPDLLCQGMVHKTVSL